MFFHGLTSLKKSGLEKMSLGAATRSSHQGNLQNAPLGYRSRSLYPKSMSNRNSISPDETALSEIPTIPEKLEQNGTDEKLKNFSEENDLKGDERTGALHELFTEKCLEGDCSHSRLFHWKMYFSQCTAIMIALLIAKLVVLTMLVFTIVLMACAKIEWVEDPNLGSRPMTSWNLTCF